ncbi:MAG: disulfide bond formation protein B [Emcibacter sp.]|nr:disulfide bond formation protein B [Emcibacter sp.]
MSDTRNSIASLVRFFWNNPLLLAFLMSTSLLAGAYGFQYIGGMEPCDLCWPQRYAHMAIALLSGAGLLMGQYRPFVGRIFGWATALALDVSIVASGYHAGVEQKWWKGPDTCTAAGLSEGTDMESLFDNMMESKVIMCDEIPWDMFGISMAGYNFLISFGVAGFVMFALLYKLRKNHDTAL